MLIINLFGNWRTLAVLLTVSSIAIAVVVLVAWLCYRWCCCRRNQDNDDSEQEVAGADETTASRNGWCSCFRRLHRRSRVREFDTLEDLLLEVEENESGRIHVDGATAEQRVNEGEDGAGCFEASLETFFPSILHMKKRKSRRRGALLDGLDEQGVSVQRQEVNPPAVEDPDQEVCIEEPLLEEPNES